MTTLLDQINEAESFAKEGKSADFIQGRTGIPLLAAQCIVGRFGSSVQSYDRLKRNVLDENSRRLRLLMAGQDPD